MRKIPPKQFDALVEEAVEGLPEEFHSHLENVEINVEPRPSRELLESLGMEADEPLFGVFQGAPEGEVSGFFDLPELPARITIFHKPIEEECTTRSEVVREIQLTVLHEVGHFFGLDEDDLERWEEEIYGSAEADEPDQDRK